jgi:hypothetical protein
LVENLASAETITKIAVGEHACKSNADCNIYIDDHFGKDPSARDGLREDVVVLDDPADGQLFACLAGIPETSNIVIISSMQGHFSLRQTPKILDFFKAKRGAVKLRITPVSRSIGISAGNPEIELIPYGEDVTPLLVRSHGERLEIAEPTVGSTWSENTVSDKLPVLLSEISKNIANLIDHVNKSSDILANMIRSQLLATLEQAYLLNPAE